MVRPSTPLRAVRSSTPTVHAALTGSERRILSIWVTAAVARLVPVRLVRDGRVRIAAAAIMVALVPVVVTFSLSRSDDASGSAALAALGWHGYYVALDLYCVWCARSTWGRLVRLGPDVDGAMTDAVQRGALAEWLQRSTRPATHWPIYLGVGAAGVVAFAAAVVPLLSGRLRFGAGAYVVVFITSCLGAENMVWVIRLPMLVRRLCSASLTLYWHAPAATPALEGSSRLLGATALCAIVGAGGFVAPVLYAYSAAQSASVAAIAVFAGAFLLFSLAGTGIYPQWLIYRCVRQAKATTLRSLIDANPSLTSAHPSPDAASARDSAEVWRIVVTSPNWTVRSETVVQYGAAMLATALSIAAPLLVGAR